MRRPLAVLALLLGAALIAPAASAALEGTQVEYRSRVEPICKAEGEAEKRITGTGPRPLAGNPRAAVREEGRRLVRSSKALGQALARLRDIPRPELDSRRLSKWLSQISEQVVRQRRAGKAAIEGEPARSQKLQVQFANASARANDLVVAYEFRHCVFGEAGFTP